METLTTYEKLKVATALKKHLRDLDGEKLKITDKDIHNSIENERREYARIIVKIENTL